MTLLYVGASNGTLQHERDNLTGLRCASAIYRPRRRTVGADETLQTHVLLDSGAFSDKPENRLTFEQALERQMIWERNAQRLWEAPNWTIEIVASYDYLLIDEQWSSETGSRVKKRWDKSEAWSAVDVSISAAAYLSSQREILRPRKLLYGCQGTTADQYAECASGILNVSAPGDVFGFGGRCILGRQPKLLQEHYETLLTVIPMVKKAGLSRVHIFGVLFEKAIAPMQWICDQHGLILSTDSVGPIKASLGKDLKKAGARRPYWRDNVAWWKNHLANINRSRWYCDPATLIKAKQLPLFAA